MRKGWMPRPVGAACLILALAALGAPAMAQDGAAAGSFRGAQEAGLNFSLRPVDLLNLPPGSPPPGSFRAAQDLGSGAAWSQRQGNRWSDGGPPPPPWAGGRDQPLDSRPRF